VNLYNVLINNQIPFVLVETNNKENVIYCNSFNDNLFNVGIFSTKTKDIILEYFTVKDDKYVKIDITFEDGKCYKDVKFKIIINESVADLPYCSFNPANLADVATSTVEFITEDTVEDNLAHQDESTTPVIEEKYVELAEKSKEYDNLILNAKLAEKKLIEEKERLKKEKLELKNQNTIKEKVDQVRDNLLQEYFNATKEQEKLLNDSINKNLNTLEDRLIETLERYSDKLDQEGSDLKSALKVQFNELKETNVELVREKIESQITAYKKDIEKFITDEIQYNQTKTATSLTEKFNHLQNSNSDKLKIVLDEYKDLLQGQVLEATENKIDNYITDVVEEKISKNNITIKKKLKEEINVEIKKYIDESVQSAKTYARRILELGGGGGSVAVQYAEGGIMNGDLTVNGKIIAKSLTINDDITICGDIFPCQTDTYNLGSSAFRWKDLHLAGNSLYLGDSVITAIGTTIVVPNQEVDGGLVVLDGDVSVSSGNYLSGGINLLDIFGSSQSITVIAGNSARWDSTYTTVKTNSASWTTYDYIINNYLNLSGGRIDGNLTINGNLTALGDASFVNTIFATTSALSVINTGVGPALYVFQAAGPYDIASFYDGDGVEVLHIGNAQPGGNGFIGINTSYPASELTVNGTISSNNAIFVKGGNSEQWNSVYNSTLQTSASWDSAYSSTTSNSSYWDSVYSSVNTNSAQWDSVYSSWNTTSGEYVTVPYLSTNNVLLSAATITDNINVGGTGYFLHVAAASKSFYIKHPTKKNKHLQYGSLESPYHGVRLTGKNSVSTSCKVILPDYISSLVSEEGINIQITNINHTKSLYVSKVDIENNYFVISRKTNLLDKNKKYEFYWSFTAIRKDIPNLIVEK